MLENRKSNCYKQRTLPFTVKYFIPRGGFILRAKSKLDGIQVRFDVAPRIDLAVLRPRLGASFLHHQPAGRLGGDERDDEEREPRGTAAAPSITRQLPLAARWALTR